MKSYTDIEQSKKLSEILPPETADMWWNYYSVTTDFSTPQIIHLDTPWVGSFNWYNEPDNIPCWSLAALLDVLPKSLIYTPNQALDGYCCKSIIQDLETYGNNPIDVCYEMILKLHELSLF